MFTLPVALTLRARLRLFALVFIAGLLCAVSAFYFVRFLVRPYTGLIITFPEVRSQNGQLLYAPRVSDSPALQAGLMPGRDRILALNGQPISSVRELVRWETDHYSFEPVTVTAADEAGAVRTVVIHPKMSVEQSGWFFLLFFIVTLGAIAFYILIHYHNEITQILFALLALFYMAYTAILPFYYESLITILIVNLGEQTAWSILIFLAFFQKDVISAPIKKILVGAVSAVITIFTAARFGEFIRWLITGQDAAYADLHFVKQVQNECDIIAYVLFLLFLILIFVRTKHREVKHHIEWITAGALLALPPHFFFDQLPQILHHTQSAPYYMGNPSSFFLSFLPLAYIIGLVRSRGYQVKILRSRLVIYIAVAFSLLAFFALLFHPTQQLFMEAFRLSGQISGFIVALSLLIVALYLQLVVFLFIDRRLLKEKRYDPTEEEGPHEARTGAASIERERERSRVESDLLLSGLLERFSTFVERTKRTCQEMEKTDVRLAGQAKAAARRERAEEPPVPGRGETASGAVRKHILAFEQFRKRFEIILKPQASIRISLALDALVDSVVRQSQRQWSGIVIDYRRQPGMKVFCSPEEIALCLLFIVENAYESLTRKNDRISIAARTHHEYVTVEIADRGNGIPLKNTALVGQPFFTTKRGHDGLGLYFMKTLLERNEGFFSLEPGAINGTRVYLHLPKTKKSAAPDGGQNP